MATTVNEISLPPAADMHLHLRQGAMCEAVTRALAGTGVDTALVMPNLQPPITTTEMAIQYRSTLQKLLPSVQFLMTLYLSPELTPDEVCKAKAAGVVGVKSYPRGVTTNSESGIESYEIYYPVFKAMEEVDMVLNLHGECPSNEEKNITVLNAEHKFLTHLEQLHRDFPNLRIVLEHATTKAAVDIVKSLGDTVGCTITVHHLFLTVDDWGGQPHHFCKPVAKTFEDRNALRAIIQSGHPRFFLGTDSAPHPRHAKESAKAPAGVFTSLRPLQYLAHLFDQFDLLSRLEGFACVFGRQFYKLPVPATKSVYLRRLGSEDPSNSNSRARTSATVPETFVVESMKSEAGGLVEVLPFLAGKDLGWSLEFS